MSVGEGAIGCVLRASTALLSLLGNEASAHGLGLSAGASELISDNLYGIWGRAMTLDFGHFTPVASLLGGALIGLAASVLILGAGRILGAAGLYGALVLHPSESWRLAWLLGLAASPLLARLIWTLPSPVFPGTTTTIAVAGLLVGFGARLGSGCTSGHGVCGLARLSPRSLAATLIFIATGFLVVFLVRHVLA